MSGRSLVVRAGSQVFCTYPVTGMVQVGSLDHALRSFHGRGGHTPPRNPPEMRPPTLAERTPSRSSTAAPVSDPAPTLGSHLWVG